MIFIGVTTYFLLVIVLVALILIMVDHVRLKKKPKKLYDGEEPSDLQEPPGPKPWPVLGSLHILGRYDVPYKAFGDLVKAYNSQIIKIKMGSVPCVVINGLENIKEVLIVKGHHFDSRPNFIRYHLLFAHGYSMLVRAKTHAKVSVRNGTKCRQKRSRYHFHAFLAHPAAGK